MAQRQAIGAYQALQHRGRQRIGRHRHRLQQLPLGRAELQQPRQHRVAHRARQAPAAPRRLGHDLRHEERVAPGGTVQPQAVAAMALGHLLHGAGRQRLQRQPRGHRRRQVAQQQRQRVLGAHLGVAVAQHQQHPQRRDAPGDEAQQVQRGMVGPVQVFQQQHRAGRQLADGRQHLGKQAALRSTLGQRAAHRAAQHRRQVVDRPQLARCEQRVTAAPGHGAGVGQLAGKGFQQAGLAHARLAAHHHHLPARGGAATGAAVQGGQRRLALQQRAVGRCAHEVRCARHPRQRGRVVDMQGAAGTGVFKAAPSNAARTLHPAWGLAPAPGLDSADASPTAPTTTTEPPTPSGPLPLPPTGHAAGPPAPGRACPGTAPPHRRAGCSQALGCAGSGPHTRPHTRPHTGPASPSHPQQAPSRRPAPGAANPAPGYRLTQRFG